MIDFTTKSGKISGFLTFSPNLASFKEQRLSNVGYDQYDTQRQPIIPGLVSLIRLIYSNGAG